MSSSNWYRRCRLEGSCTCPRSRTQRTLGTCPDMLSHNKRYRCSYPSGIGSTWYTLVRSTSCRHTSVPRNNSQSCSRYPSRTSSCMRSLHKHTARNPSCHRRSSSRCHCIGRHPFASTPCTMRPRKPYQPRTSGKHLHHHRTHSVRTSTSPPARSRYPDRLLPSPASRCHSARPTQLNRTIGTMRCTRCCNSIHPRRNR